MNIETKRFRVKSMDWPSVEILEKATGDCAYVESSRLPSVNALAQMTEAAFDRLMVELSA